MGTAQHDTRERWGLAIKAALESLQSYIINRPSSHAYAPRGKGDTVELGSQQTTDTVDLEGDVSCSIAGMRTFQLNGGYV